jgi:organic radical activating enzyme
MSYCNAVWRRRFIESSGKVFPCCQFDRRHDYDLNDVKDKMMNNLSVAECERCDKQEQGGEESMRQVYNKQYGHTTDDTVKDIEIGVDNICNLQCVMCSSRASHRLYDVENKLFGVSVSDSKYLKNEMYKEYDWTKVESLHLYGGEPFYSPNVKAMFDYIEGIVDWSKLIITGSTNCTTMPDSKLLERFKQCKLFKFNLSIDAYGNLNNYIRTNSDWNTVVANMQKYHNLVEQHQNIQIEVYSTISIYNANKYDELETFVKQRFPLFDIELQNLQIPEWQCIANTPEDYKDLVRKSTKNPTILNFLEMENENLIDQFVYFTNTLKPLGLEEVNIELYNYLKQYNVKDCKGDIIAKIKEYKL